MPISNVLINVTDIRRSVDFYTTYLRAQTIGEVTEESAELDLVTATVQLKRIQAPAASTWLPDDLQRGFRHIGFKVAEVDPVVAELDSAGIDFHLRPIDAEGAVRITFFFDPDGTLLELVEGDLRYHDIADHEGVARERSLGIPSRPRFDHVAVTAAEVGAIRERYEPFGFELIGSIHQVNDARGFEIDYLKSGDTVLEVFTFTAPTTGRAAQLDARGLSFVSLGLGAEQYPPRGDEFGAPIGIASDGRAVYMDSDGLAFARSR